MFTKQSRETVFRALDGDYEDLSEDQRASFESVSESQRMIITELLTEIEGLEKRKERYDARIVRVIEELKKDGDKDVSFLVTIPGVGLPSAAVTKVEIGAVDRSASPEKSSLYTGLAPRVYQSGSVNRNSSRSSRRMSIRSEVVKILCFYLLSGFHLFSSRF